MAKKMRKNNAVDEKTAEYLAIEKAQKANLAKKTRGGYECAL